MCFCIAFSIKYTYKLNEQHGVAGHFKMRASLVLYSVKTDGIAGQAYACDSSVRADHNDATHSANKHLSEKLVACPFGELILEHICSLNAVNNSRL